MLSDSANFYAVYSRSYPSYSQKICLINLLWFSGVVSLKIGSSKALRQVECGNNKNFIVFDLAAILRQHHMKYDRLLVDYLIIIFLPTRESLPIKLH